MRKDITIENLIKKLKQKMSIDDLEIVDYWDADLCAIGLKKGNKLIYINTFNSLPSRPVYDYDLEILTNKIDKFQVIKKARRVTEEEIIKAVKEFFDI
ncbi:MAG: hypothetical protein Q8N66_14450 [Bacteroidota bacterium]|nr:hypothetical protein [Bacteroidota bacterium]